MLRELIDVAWRGVRLFLKVSAGVWREFFAKRGPSLAAAISFYTMLCLFPLSLLILIVFSWVLGQSGTVDAVQRLIEVFQQIVPPLRDETASVLVESLSNALGGTARPAGSLTAIVLLLLASSAVFGSIRNSINTIWGISAKRSFWVDKLMDLIMTVGAVFLLFISVGVSTLTSGFEEFFAVLLPGLEAIPWQLVLFFAPPLVSFAVFAFLYWWLPYARLRFVTVLPAALATTVAFEISKQIFILYLGSVNGLLGNVYGAFSAVIVLLTFIYVSSIILLVGALVTSRFVFYINTVERRNLNRRLSHNLARMRNSETLSGIPIPASYGAADDEPYTPFSSRNRNVD